VYKSHKLTKKNYI